MRRQAGAGVRDPGRPGQLADPGGRHIQLALNMVQATAPKSQQQGILLINPGGPGGSGLGLTEEVAIGLGKNVAADYDVVGFDPRGVGASVPALSCDPDFFSGVRPTTSRRGGCRAGPGQPGEVLRRQLRAPVRLAAPVHDDPGFGP